MSNERPCREKLMKDWVLWGRTPLQWWRWLKWETYDKKRFYRHVEAEALEWAGIVGEPSPHRLRQTVLEYLDWVGEQVEAEERAMFDRNLANDC